MFLQVINNSIIYKFSKMLLTTGRRLTGWQFLAVDLFPNVLNTGTSDETFQQTGQLLSFRHLLKIQLVCKKVQAHISLEPPEIQHDQMSLTNQGSLRPFKPSQQLEKYYAVSDYFQKGKQVKRYLSYQDQPSLKSFSKQF